VKDAGFGTPQSFSVAPAPRPTERSLVAMGWAISARAFDSAEAVDKFLHSEEGLRATATAQPEGPWERAQDLAYDAWEATGAIRYVLAREALAIDERCSDAWLVLAEEEKAWKKQKRCFDRAVAAAERFGEDEGLFAALTEEDRRCLYGTIPGRTVMRAYVALARCLVTGGHRREAQELYEKLLDLDCEDHMAIRHEVVPLYHLLDDRKALRTLLDRYPEDAMAPLPYEQLWLAISEGTDPAEVEHLEQKARNTNPYVIDFLLGTREWPDRTSQYTVIGGEDEAANYVEMAEGWWLADLRTRAWLLAKRGSVAGSASTTVGEFSSELDEFKCILHRLYHDGVSVREFMQAYGALNDMDDDAFTAAMGWVAREIDPYLSLLTFTYADQTKHGDARIWIEGGRPRSDRPDLQQVLDRQYKRAQRDGLVF